MPNIDSQTTHDKVVDTKERINKKAFEIARQNAVIQENNARDIQTRYRQARDADTRQQWESELQQTDKDGFNLWQRLKNRANEYIRSGQTTMHDWRSAMMDLLSLFTDLVSALQKSMRSTLAPITMPIKQFFRDTLLYPTRDKIVNALRGDFRLNIPELVYNIHMDENNQLKLDDIKTVTGEDFQLKYEDGTSCSLEEDLKLLTTLWLTDMDYKKMDDNTYVNIDANSPDYNQVLTKEKFENLKNDPDKGLDHFIRMNSEVKFSPTVKL